jgi:MOSC domain-containing protein YiiM
MVACVPGFVETIWICGESPGPVESVPSARALAGRGLAGDRYLAAPDATANAGDALTLVEAEAIDAISAEHGIVLEPGGTRRNVVTRGIALNDLVGREFTVGEVRCRGVELCEPCLMLQQITGEPNLIKALVHRGGLRADILTDGEVAVGDAVSG